MLDILSAVEKELPALLKEGSAWESLCVDYHPPTVERLWRNWCEFRIYLHRIHPCPQGQALFHPHPWPSAMRILSGKYEMAVGYGKGDAPPPIAALMHATGDFRYEMTDPDAWHYVRPIGEPTVSLMVTGKPWERWSPKSAKTLHPLQAEQGEEILRLFRQHYPKRYRLISREGTPYESTQPGTLGGNSKLRIYGQLDCGSANAALAKGYARIRVFFADEATAIAAGYRPCGHCMRKRYQEWLRGGESGSAEYPWTVLPPQKAKPDA